MRAVDLALVGGTTRGLSRAGAEAMVAAIGTAGISFGVFT
jgi:hypothetical protein